MLMIVADGVIIQIMMMLLMVVFMTYKVDGLLYRGKGNNVDMLIGPVRSSDATRGKSNKDGGLYPKRTGTSQHWTPIVVFPSILQEQHNVYEWSCLVRRFHRLGGVVLLGHVLEGCRRQGSSTCFLHVPAPPVFAEAFT